MSSNMFKLSSITFAVVASFGANAAIYNVYDYQPVVDSNAKTYGVAVEPETTNCWGNACDQSTSKIAYEEKLYYEGFNYRDEAPFRYEFGYDLLEEGYDGFTSYCSKYLGYNSTLCDDWATDQYTNGYARESSAVNNSYAYIENASSQVQSTQNNVIVNSFATGSGDAVGTYYGGSLKNRTVAYSDTSLDSTGYDQSKVWAKSGALYVGSVTKQSTNNTNDYYSYGAVWNGSTLNRINWVSDVGEDGRSMPQGSARDLADVSGTTYAVGYNSDSDEKPVAAVFNLTNLGSIPTSFVSRFQNESNYLSSILTSVNTNGIAIGEVKYSTPLNGAYANSLFYITDPANPNGSYNEFSGDIFFSGASGKAGAINNNDEVVGAVDNQTHHESGGGKPRSQRAFIAPLTSNAKAPLNNRAWYLDDLTNDGSTSSTNNQFRIIDATDINDAGVISGTALYCSGGYDSTAIDSKCNGGVTGSEKTIAVKLVPINGATTSDIQARPVTQEDKVDRQGGSLGFFALTLLGLLGFRRK
ncbi:DUF3466 family protein [Vibrio neptunius]|uniref:DUF3466 family protein n=2 Tax=Vibrio neptunius TaxID=170651 RepID=A0ABS3A1E8_9VIBR|nr:DUF3466 family protein [Vibrio neptunius]MBN3515709.1 DUF3466 family protein [Vibrio neptunius]MBN3549882.1 DUF3466 family protein [Vibrio neptunius]MBN3578014.1 DUF3466 family protein [Vibrio neptunius]MCH9871678.1 DUF3466 family protein [Vibrio neptunius]